MRVLHILDHSLPLHSGYTFRTLSILTAQRSLGVETAHLTIPKQTGCTAAEETVDGWHFYRTEPARGPTAELPVLKELELLRRTTRRLEQVARLVQPDVLHAHSPVLTAIPALRVGRRLGVPVVYEVRAFWEDAAVDHGSTREGSLRYRLTRALETYALRRADAITVICEGLKRDIVERGISPEKITVVPNSVDVEKFGPNAERDERLRTELGLQHATVVGFVGSFYAYEGLDLLVSALPGMLERLPNVRLLLVGGGPQESALRRQVEELGLSSKVVFTGRVPHGEVTRYYGLIDLLVYPRRSMRLTELVTPLKPLEAMAQRQLFIASDVGGHKELIQDGKTGFLFKAGDAAALAQKVAAVLADPERAEAVRRAARQYVETERNWLSSASCYPPLYARLCRDRAVGARATAEAPRP